MAVIETSRTAPFGAISTLRFVEFFERASRAVKAKFVADETYRTLSKLSPRQLQDIGLGEQDLTAFSRDIARRAV
ncbi:MAG: DUF1127 domain-containing protein [Pseudomonadota bacterium]